MKFGTGPFFVSDSTKKLDENGANRLGPIGEINHCYEQLCYFVNQMLLKYMRNHPWDQRVECLFTLI